MLKPFFGATRRCLQASRHPENLFLGQEVGRPPGIPGTLNSPFFGAKLNGGEDRNAIAVVDRGIQTLKKDLATRVARKGGQWSDHFERAAGAYDARPCKTVHGAPEDVEKQPATEFRVLQDNADKFQRNKDLTDHAGAFRAPTNAARSFNPQYGDVQQLGAVDSMTVRSTEGRETLLKLALPAPQGSGNAAGGPAA